MNQPNAMPAIDDGPTVWITCADCYRARQRATRLGGVRRMIGTGEIEVFDWASGWRGMEKDGVIAHLKDGGTPRARKGDATGVPSGDDATVGLLEDTKEVWYSCRRCEGRNHAKSVKRIPVWWFAQQLDEMATKGERNRRLKI